MKNMITKREILFSIVIVAVMILFGFLISSKIQDSLMNKYQEYNTALQIENNHDLFDYGIRTNVGNAFVYGNLKAIDTVTYDEISGQYSYIEKVKERYTKHTKTVTKSRKNSKGETEYYNVEEDYWTWDEIDRWDKHSKTISFLNIEFDYGTIEFPYKNEIETIKESSNIRYIYYGSPAECVGTLYAKLGNQTISETHFYNNSTIEETIKTLESNWQGILFWVLWIVLTGGFVIGFYYIDNKWLEDR